MRKADKDKEKLDEKKKNKELVEQGAERLAEILCMQVEWNGRNRRKKNHDKEKI